MPIDILTDNVLLEIFSFCISGPFEFGDPCWHTRQWQTLVHVCQRWRGIIFASPRWLNLHLTCSYGIPVRKNLVFWPITLPLIVDYDRFGGPITPEDEDNIVAALEHPSRVRYIDINGEAPLIKKVAITLRKSFPVLTGLELGTSEDSVIPVVLSRRFLGGSAIQHLHHLHLTDISFPQLSSPLSSARNLLSLTIAEMPANGYISPDAMVKSLATLTRLEHLYISFYEEISPSDQWGSHTHPQTRTILPALTDLNYDGRSEYLEEFLARIDTPRVNSVKIEYSIHRIQALQLSRFIERTEIVKIDPFTRAQVYFSPDDSLLGLNRSQEAWTQGGFYLKIIGTVSFGVQVRVMMHLVGQLAASVFSKVDDLFVHRDNRKQQSGGMGLTKFLRLFRLFPAVETLRLSGKLAVSVASALEDITEEMVTDLLPALSMIRISECDNGYPEDKLDDADDWMEEVGSMERFLSLRQLSGCPVRVIHPKDELAEVEPIW